MSTIRAIVVGSFEPAQEELLRSVDGVDLAIVENQCALAETISSAEVVAGTVNADLLARAPGLKWVHSWAAGPNEMLYTEMLKSSVILTCAKGNGAVPLAEHAMLLMMMLNSGSVAWMDAQRERRWGRHPHNELQGRTCGIIGLGGSGRDLAQKAQAFHMHVLGVRRNLQATPFVDEVLPQRDLHELMRRSDFVVITTPLTDETRGLVGKGELKAMRPTAFLVNISRGGIIDDDALVRALREQWIAGAGLDAHGVEPLPQDSPFWTTPNTIITPHNGATTPQTTRRGLEIFVDNLARYVEGRPLNNIVEKAAGY